MSGKTEKKVGEYHWKKSSLFASVLNYTTRLFRQYLSTPTSARNWPYKERRCKLRALTPGRKLPCSRRNLVGILLVYSFERNVVINNKHWIELNLNSTCMMSTLVIALWCVHAFSLKDEAICRLTNVLWMSWTREVINIQSNHPSFH